MATAAPLKNKRLSNFDRDRLKSFAKRQIEATQDRAALNDAYERAADAVRDAVEARWPQKDMKVLAKYGSAAPDSCVYVSVGNGDYDRFCFRADDKRIPLRPNHSCNRQPVLVEGAAAEHLSNHAALVEADRQQVSTRFSDFKALIDNTPNFNSLATTWPAVEALRGEIVGHSASLSVLSNEVVDRLKADPAFEMAEAA